jgi:hypothetical protein
VDLYKLLKIKPIEVVDLMQVVLPEIDGALK